MYSVVLMTALTTAPDGAGFNGYFRDLFHGNSCNGCNGCSGGVRYSCYGGGCSGSVAYPASCSGCCGSSCNGGSVFGLGLGDRVRSFFDRDSRYGCCGSHSYGCSGSSYSCSGYSCSGYSCSGYSCSGSAYSCFGGPAVSYTPIAAGGLSCQGGLIYPAPPAFDPYTPAPGQPYAIPVPAPGALGRGPTAPTATATVSNSAADRATVLVRLPADAKLFADGRAMNLTGAERTFVSPVLPADQEFAYQFRAEYERGGRTVSETQKVTVRAGSTSTVEFADLTAARPTETNAGKTTSNTPPTTAPSAEPTKAEPPARPAPAAPAAPNSDRATITVKLPPGATLFVDNTRSPSQEPVRQFATPPLPANREFAYVLKAEITRDGRPESLTQKVPFRAGERVVVDFTSLGGK